MRYYVIYFATLLCVQSAYGLWPAPLTFEHGSDVLLFDRDFEFICEETS